jgi:hypothetical protein
MPVRVPGTVAHHLVTATWPAHARPTDPHVVVAALTIGNDGPGSPHSVAVRWRSNGRTQEQCGHQQEGARNCS